MNYQESLAYLESLNIFGIKLGLERIQKLLARLELPQERYRTIHVTGTNGKGSVSAMLAGILRHSGIHTGFYSSPHLVSYTERIRVDGQAISEQE
ncbi:MAG: bifunctional folylpolyglutamate synthase/dihydrofolate synthase, partial [Selenomonas sp.]|nr:bifunctional folylpolyglutamate synthase/dihydrofolate synthase [Selenomonas sp.]